MGALDQFAKETFAEETEVVTEGAAVWCPPQEIGLEEVRLDGMLVMRDGARLATLGAPWKLAAELDELVLEVKMVGDHVGILALQRALLRRQARQVVRTEQNEASPWEGEEPLWVVAPHLPDYLRVRRVVTPLAPGCYGIGPASFPFLWIAANELPLREDLIPFLVARSGRALDEFGLWVKAYRPREWLASVVQILPMSPRVREDIATWIRQTDEPHVRENRRYLAKTFIEGDAELEAEVTAKARDEGEILGERTALRLILKQRELAPSAEEDARIDACTDATTIKRWIVQAVVAPTVAEALR